MAKEKEQPWVSELTDAVIAEIIRRLTKDMKLDSKEFGKTCCQLCEKTAVRKDDCWNDTRQRHFKWSNFRNPAEEVPTCQKA
jgi:hypothetical protein